MNPFFLLLGMYTGFAALLFASGYIYKTKRDQRIRQKEQQRKLDFDQPVDEPKPQRRGPTVAVR
jgi:hypothetical protein